MINKVSAYSCPICSSLYKSEAEAESCYSICRIKARRLPVSVKRKKLARYRRSLLGLESPMEVVLYLPVLMKRVFAMDMTVSQISISWDKRRVFFSVRFFYSLSMPKPEITIRRTERVFLKKSLQELSSPASVYQHIFNKWSDLSVYGLRGDSLDLGTNIEWKGEGLVERFPKIASDIREIDRLSKNEELLERQVRLVTANYLEEIDRDLLVRVPKYALLESEKKVIKQRLEEISAEQADLKLRHRLAYPRIALGPFSEEMNRLAYLKSKQGI